MGLCSYFINGNCRFGSKCVNDHIDLKTMLKNEADAVINGKQWLLSSFGPFKESVVVPNFIPDQSFEEIRIGFLENSKNGNLQSFLNNLMMEYNNAMRKMNELKTPSSDLLQLIASIYNTSNTSDQKAKPAQSQAPNPFQSSNILGGTTQQQTLPSSSIFGASTTQNNPFQQATTQQPSSSLFGASNNNPQTSAFSFNQSVQDPQKSSIFGQSSVFNSSQTQPQNAGSIFSNNQSSIFGQQASTFAMPATQPGTSVFGTTAVQQPSQSIFGSTSVQQPTQNIFAASSVPQSSQSTFGATAVPQPSQNIFAAAPITQQQPVSNIFGGNTVQNPPVQNIFGGTTAVQSQPVTQNVFGGSTVAQQPSQNLFSQATNSQNVFAQNQPQTQTFGQSTSVFGTNQQPQQQSDSMSGNIFNIQAPQTSQASNAFGGNPFQQTVAINDEHFYSKDENLSPEYIQAFQADTFIPGKIPILPPSRSLALS